MTDVHRQGKRPKGITDTMHRAIRQAKREHYENDIIHNLMTQLNGPAKSSGKQHRSPQMQAGKASPASSASGKTALNSTPRQDEFPNLVHMITTRSSVLKGTGKQEGGMEKQNSKGTSTDYSTDAVEEAALKEENERIRQLCAVEEEKLTRMEKQINEENKAQMLRLQLYKQKIDKLKKIVALEIFPTEEV